MKKNFTLIILMSLIVCNVVIFSYLYYLTEAKLMVAFLDVGQGDAIFVKAPNGRQMLIDGGMNSAVLRELGQVMPFYDRSIDVVVATHADADHIGGLVEVLKRYEVDLFIRSNATSSSAVYLALENIIKSKNIREEIIISPTDLTLAPETEFKILFPDRDTSGWETNDSSIVGQLIYGDSSFLLTGDSPASVEKILVDKLGSSLKSDVLKAGHHGSKTSSSELFVGTVLPTYTIISAGRDNKYGHPNQEIIEILTKFDSKIIKTMGQGRVVFKTDGNDLNFFQKK